jgi:hypothetical protein
MAEAIPRAPKVILLQQPPHLRSFTGQAPPTEDRPGRDAYDRGLGQRSPPGCALRCPAHTRHTADKGRGVRHTAPPVIGPAKAFQGAGHPSEPSHRVAATRVGEGEVGGIPEGKSRGASRKAHVVSFVTVPHWHGSLALPDR